MALAASAIEPYDRLTWLLEVAWVIVGLPIVFATRRRHALTALAYVLLAAHALLLIAGGQWTYARVPLGEWLRDWLHLARNPYDRIGHLAQGFVPAVWGRELLLRAQVVNGRRWLLLIVTALCLAFSASFELLEWQAAVAFGADADAYLATQGDPWDTQWDMFCCLCGAIAAQLLCARLLDRQIAARPWLRRSDDGGRARSLQ
ncbi:MAG TPA: DUF2238 domain-containing protein [Planctomycetota bacterium]|nr:DUF2238 domain-containing protein [Planctomycetota bacterium]